MSSWKKIYAMIMVEKIPFKFYDLEGIDTFEIEFEPLIIQCTQGGYLVNGISMSYEEIKSIIKGL